MWLFQITHFKELNEFKSSKIPDKKKEKEPQESTPEKRVKDKEMERPKKPSSSKKKKKRKSSKDSCLTGVSPYSKILCGPLKSKHKETYDSCFA